MRFASTLATHLALVAVTFSTACSSNAGRDDLDGALLISLELADGAAIDEVEYAISGNGIEELSGTIDTSAPGATASVEVFGLPPGDGYQAALSTMTVDGEITCRGESTFDVLEGRATEVYVYLDCKPGTRYGGLRANGKLNLCAELQKVVVSPLQTSIGNEIALGAAGVDADGDVIRYQWSGRGGEIADPHADATTYACVDVGVHAVRVTASDREPCLDEWTVAVVCVDDGSGPRRRWTAPQLLERGAKAALNPQVAVDEEGNAVVVFEQPDDRIWSIRANRYVVDVGWDEVQSIENTDGLTDPPVVAVDGSGNTIAIWGQSDATALSDISFWAARHTIADGWDAPQIISGTVGNFNGLADIAFDPRGNALAVWSRITEGFSRYDVWSNRYEPLAGWESAVELEGDNIASASNPQVGADAEGNAIAVWIQSEHLWANYYAPGSGWGTPEVAAENAHGDTFSAPKPDLVVDPNGAAIAAWERRPAGSPLSDIIAVRYEPASGWSIPQAIDDESSGLARHVRLGGDAEGNVIAVWEQYDGSAFSVWTRRYEHDAGWGASMVLEHIDIYPANDPAIAVHPGGSAIVVWDQNGGVREQVLAAHYSPELGWADPRVVSDEERSFAASAVQVGMDASGGATAVWEQREREGDNFTSSIWAARFE